MHRVQVTRLSWRELDDRHPSGRRELEKVKKKKGKRKARVITASSRRQKLWERSGLNPILGKFARGGLTSS